MMVMTMTIMTAAGADGGADGGEPQEETHLCKWISHG